jgi:amino acid permease
MTEDINESKETPEELPLESKDISPASTNSSKKITIISISIIIVILALVVLATIFLVNPTNSQTTEQIRDVFIIFMALESLVIGVALVVLIVQLSTLINLLQNEIRPIINSTNETVNTLKGTAKFISDNLSEPVIKINQFMAMLKQLVNPRKRK